MNQEKFLEELRELWRTNQHEILKKRYLLGRWILTEEQRKKIEDVIGKIDKGKQDPLIEYAISKGCKIIE
jgi:hypothetical protein